MYLPRRANHIYPCPWRSATQIHIHWWINLGTSVGCKLQSARVGHRIKTRVLQRRFTTTDKRAAASSSSHLQKAQGEELLTPAALVKCGRRSYVPRPGRRWGLIQHNYFAAGQKRFQQAHSDCYLFLEGKPITMAICLPPPFKVWLNLLACVIHQINKSTRKLLWNCSLTWMEEIPSELSC